MSGRSSRCRARAAGRGAALVLAGLVAAVGVAVGRAPPAGAHAALVRSEPAASATVADPPSTVRLWFEEEVVAEATAVDVATSGGAEVATRLRPRPGEPGLVVADLPGPVEEGVYVVRWRVLSAADGHVTQGVLAFGVGAGSDPATAGVGARVAAAPAQDVLLRWLYFLALAAVLGPVAVALGVLGTRRCRAVGGGRADSLRRAAQARLLGAAAVGAGVAAAVGAAAAARDAGRLTSGAGTLESTAAELLVGTRWGVLWLVRELMLVIAAGCLILLRWAVRYPRAGRAVARFAAAGAVGSATALAVAQALSGHAAADSTPGLAVAADAAHLVGAACWTGGLAALLSLGSPKRAGWRGELTGAAWRSFGLLAAPCVAVIGLTGVYAMAGGVASLDAALRTTYGRALLGKVALFAVMGLLGLASAAALHPAVALRLDAALGRVARRLPARHDLRRLVLVEAALGAAVLLLAAVAAASPPASGPEFARASADPPGTHSGTAGDMLVSLSAYPNRPGDNLLRARATSTRRQAPDEIALVLVRLAPGSAGASVDTVPLSPIGDGAFEASTDVLRQPGPWRVEVVVRRAGVEDATVAFDWEVPGAAPAPELISDRPWRGLLEALVLVLAVAEVSAVVVFARRTLVGRRLPAAADGGVPAGPVAAVEPVEPAAGGAHR